MAECRLLRRILDWFGHRSATQTLDRHGHLYPSDLDTLAERLDRAHAAAATDGWPQDGPSVVRLSKRPGQ
jgi:hypothetical protein